MEKAGFRCAWSNEAFELWFCLHFIDLTAAVSRKQYIEILEREIRKFDPKFTYSKGGEPVLWKEDEDLPSCAKDRWAKALAPVLDLADAFNEGETDMMTYSFDPMAKQWIVSWQNDRERECTKEGASRK